MVSRLGSAVTDVPDSHLRAMVVRDSRGQWAVYMRPVGELSGR